MKAPSDRPHVVNNVLRTFRANSEVDRQRATQILDYIIERRKMVDRRREEATENMKEVEQLALLKQIESEKKAKGNKYTEESDDFDEFEKDDKYGKIL